MNDDRYLTLNGLVDYSTLSIRTIRRYIADARHPLPVHRLGGRVLFKRSEFDQWLREHQDRAQEIDYDEVRRVAVEIRGAAKH